MSKEERIFVNGDSGELWIKDYNVRVLTGATVAEQPRKYAKKILVILDYIDGDTNVCCTIRRSKIKRIKSELLQGAMKR